jgi:uncharacterized protein DUF3347
MKAKLVIILTKFTLAAFAANARAGCCDPKCPMMMHTANSDQNAALMEPVKSVFDDYLTIQSALAKDSIDGIAASASAISKAIRGDSMKMLSPEIAAQADALTNAKDLASAREAFKPLSKSLIAYLNANNVSGVYVEVYCPMAKASWLQKGDKIDNPYLGSSMRSCGQIQQKTNQKTS